MWGRNWVNATFWKTRHRVSYRIRLNRWTTSSCTGRACPGPGRGTVPLPVPGRGQGWGGQAPPLRNPHVTTRSRYQVNPRRNRSVGSPMWRRHFAIARMQHGKSSPDVRIGLTKLQRAPDGARVRDRVGEEVRRDRLAPSYASPLPARMRGRWRARSARQTPCRGTGGRPAGRCSGRTAPRSPGCPPCSPEW